MPLHYLPLAIFLTSLIGIVYPLSLWFILIISFAFSIYALKKLDKNQFKPQSKAFKDLEKLKKKKIKIEVDKHKTIADQLEYIALNWGYSKEQSKIIENFLLQKAYKNRYNTLNASLLPQIIKMIESCNEKEKKGCKREVSKRISELSKLLKEETNSIKKDKKEEFDITLEVYDRLQNNKL